MAFNWHTCCSQMLEYLYDLLETSERQAWEAHLNECASCQAEWVRAKRQQQLLALAAKIEFANVSFTPPRSGGTGTPPTATEGAPALGTSREYPHRWRRWLAAAV